MRLGPPKIFLSLLNNENPILCVRKDTVVVIATLAWRLLTSLLIPYFLNDQIIRISPLASLIIVVIALLLALVNASTSHPFGF